MASRSARHTFILVLVALSGCVAAFGGWRFAKASAPVNGPIVLISIDSLRADHLPTYGYARARTPVLDALAADGIVFERAYAHVPETLPAHAALLTGRLPFETGVRDVAGYSVPGSARTIAELLADRGYATGGIVSSFLLRKDTGIGRGFSFFDAELPEPDHGGSQAWLMRDGMESEQVAEHWLDSAGTTRAFLFLHIAEPHAPHQAPQALSNEAPYDAEIEYADAIVGKLVKYLKSHQLYDRSTILVVSDHGEGLGDHGEQGHGLLVYEEALRIPLIVKQPGGESRGRRVSVPVQQIDVVPTILDLAKAPGAGGLRGRSLTPLFSGGSIASSPIYAESMYGQYRFGWAPTTSIIDDRYQLIVSGSREELFDLREPPATRHDLSLEKADVLSAARKSLAEITARPTAVKAAPVTPTDRERFEALGYVGMPGAPPLSIAEPPVPADLVGFVERYRAAVMIAHSGTWPEVLDAYRALTREQPEMADVWLQLARVAARNEKQDVAIDAYRHALALEPDNLVAHLGAAASNLRARRLDDVVVNAQFVLDSAASGPVQKAEGHELLARVALGRRDTELARSEAAAAEKEDPRRPVRAFVEGRLAMDQARYADAVESFTEALSAAEKTGRPPLTDLRVFAAESLVRVERTDEAEELLNAERLAFPANTRARQVLQSLYRATGRAKDAVALAQH